MYAETLKWPPSSRQEDHGHQQSWPEQRGRLVQQQRVEADQGVQRGPLDQHLTKNVPKDPPLVGGENLHSALRWSSLSSPTELGCLAPSSVRVLRDSKCHREERLRALLETRDQLLHADQSRLRRLHVADFGLLLNSVLVQNKHHVAIKLAILEILDTVHLREVSMEPIMRCMAPSLVLLAGSHNLVVAQKAFMVSMRVSSTREKNNFVTESLVLHFERSTDKLGARQKETIIRLIVQSMLLQLSLNHFDLILNTVAKLRGMILRMIGDHHKRVRLASLELIATMVHVSGQRGQIALLRIMDHLANCKEDVQGVRDAVEDRLQRGRRVATLNRVNGTVDFGLDVYSDRGRDVDYVMMGSGSASSASARSVSTVRSDDLDDGSKSSSPKSLSPEKKPGYKPGKYVATGSPKRNTGAKRMIANGAITYNTVPRIEGHSIHLKSRGRRASITRSTSVRRFSDATEVQDDVIDNYEHYNESSVVEDKAQLADDDSPDGGTVRALGVRRVDGSQVINSLIVSDAKRASETMTTKKSLSNGNLTDASIPSSYEFEEEFGSDKDEEIESVEEASNYTLPLNSVTTERGGTVTTTTSSTTTTTTTTSGGGTTTCKPLSSSSSTLSSSLSRIPLQRNSSLRRKKTFMRNTYGLDEPHALTHDNPNNLDTNHSSRTSTKTTPTSSTATTSTTTTSTSAPKLSHRRMPARGASLTNSKLSMRPRRQPTTTTTTTTTTSTATTTRRPRPRMLPVTLRKGYSRSMVNLSKKESMESRLEEEEESMLLPRTDLPKPLTPTPLLIEENFNLSKELDPSSLMSTRPSLSHTSTTLPLLETVNKTRTSTADSAFHSDLSSSKMTNSWLTNDSALPSTAGSSGSSVLSGFANVSLRTRITLKSPFDGHRLECIANELLNDNFVEVAIEEMKNSNWEDNIKGLVSVVRLARHHKNELITHHKAVVQGVLKQVQNLRSQVSRVAVMTLAELFNRLGPVLESDVDRLSRILIQKTGDSNKFLREDCHVALDAMVDHTTPFRCVVAITNEEVMAHKNPQIRATVARLVALVVNDRLGAEQTMFSMGNREAITPRIIPALGRLAQDSNADARKYARRTIALLMESSEVNEVENVFKKHVTQNTMRGVTKVIESLGQQSSSNKNAAARRPISIRTV